MKICIVGGGNIGTAMAVDFAVKNHKVNIFTSKPEKWSSEIFAVDKSGKKFFGGKLNLVTDNFLRAAESAEYIFVTLPSNVQRSFAEKISAFVNSSMKFIMVPGFGGAEFLMQPAIKRGAKLFGLQRVSCIARLKEYGHSVWYENKSSISLAAFNKKNFETVRQDMEKIFEIHCAKLPNYLCVTFTPSNPVLHTSRLYSMFKNFQSLKENPLFYASWTDEASEVLFELDEEVQSICHELSEINLNSVVSLKKHYESNTPAALTKKLKSISSLSKISSPVIQTDVGWMPDFDNSYFTCDFGYGLDILLQFAEILNLQVPTMKKIMQWYNSHTGEKESRINLKNYGLTSKEKILEFYTA